MLIQTKFHGPTNHRGARISARDVETGKRIIRPYRYDLDPWTAHRIVASELADWPVIDEASSGEGRWWTLATIIKTDNE